MVAIHPPYSPPAILRVRDLKSARACLTVFRKTVDQGGINLSQVNFIDPAALVLLYHAAGSAKKSVMVYPSENAGVRRYFEVHHRHAEDPTKLTIKSLRAFPLRYISREGDVSTELGKWREQIMDMGALEEEAARNLSMTLSEVLMNSFSHGGRKNSCLVAGQTFSQKGHTMITAADFGKTIPATLIDSGRFKDQGADHHWIRLALDKGITCRSRPTNRGLGLHFLRQQVERARGTLLIISRNGIVRIGPGGLEVCESLGNRYSAFKGTFLSVDLPVK